MAQNTSNSLPQVTAELVLPVNDLAHLFNAPQVVPANPGPLEGLGISGVDYLLNQLHLDRPLQRARTLTLVLPAALASTSSPEVIRTALQNHLRWRIEREQRDLRNTYRYGWRVTVFAVLTLAICLGVSSLFASEMTEWLGPLLRKTFEYGFEIIGWVVLWHPIDVLVFSPVSIRARLNALQALAGMDIAFRTETSPASAAAL